ncbi:MAG TPA: plastocyanin/azurin family copper-binding protein [Gaiellaceae bacterium]
MFRTLLAGLVVVAASLAIASTALSRPAVTTLNGTVGPAFTIKLTKGGVKVTKLTAGKYKFKIADKSNAHDFSLKGPGMNKHLTGVGFVGNKTVSVTLKKGKYTYYCSVHPTLMKGSFTVK